MADRPHWYRDDRDHITRAPRRRPPTRSKVQMLNCPLCHGEGDVLGNQANVTGGQGMRCPVCIGQKQLLANDSIFNHPKMVRNIRDKAIREHFQPSQIENIDVDLPEPEKAVRQGRRIEQTITHERHGNVSVKTTSQLHAKDCQCISCSAGRPASTLKSEPKIEKGRKARKKAKSNRQGFSFKRFLVFLLLFGVMAAAAGVVLFPDEAMSVVQTLTERKVIIIR